MKKGDGSLFRFDRSGGCFSFAEKDSRPLFGFSLLEVVLALAILAGALAALGEVMRMGDQNAERARDETQAEVLANSVMSELVCGARVLGNVNGAVFDLATEPPWNYSIAVEATEYSELVAVRVSVAQQIGPELQPARCDLVRWLPNPDYLATLASEQATASSETSSSSSSLSSGASANSSATGQGTGGGQQR
jgi:type II secretion system protein I